MDTLLIKKGDKHMNLEKRVHQLRQVMDDKELTCSVILNFENQYYFSGLKAITYSRPIVLFVDQQHTKLVVPSLEETHAKEKSIADHLLVYYETPLHQTQANSYTELFEEVIASYPKNSKIGVEFASLPVELGKRLRDKGFDLVSIDDEIIHMRAIKEEAEIEQIIESGNLVSLALKESLEHATPEMTEMEIDQFGNTALFLEVAKRHPNSTLDYFVMSPSGIERTNMPHVFSNTRQLNKNDLVIHSRQVGINGYRAECERTFFVGNPSLEQEEAFKLAQEAQQAALDFIRVGVTAAEVNEVALQVFRDANMEQYVRHRTGHGIGIGLHEEPSLKYSNDLVLQENMVFCVEPGLYIPGVGGFRHSDTVILRGEGTQLITHYPSKLEDLIL